MADQPLQPGTKAPSVELAIEFGKNHSLAEYRGKKNVLVAFYPLAFTPG
ncbi:MAG: redoxin domain-containing protein [Candidatus Tectomicrobia bacterium]|nr:redoxin domain-containing protein [Candidatus Tectomicrobia bacterium]